MGVALFMSRDESTYDDDDDIFDVVSTDDEFENELDTKSDKSSSEDSPLAKRRMIEAKLEEHRLRKQIEDDFDFSDDDDEDED